MTETAGRLERPAVTVRQVQERGISAAPVILDYARENDVDLVVMGTHGRRGVRRMLLGSVTDEVLRAAPCPVLTVRGGDAEARRGHEPPERLGHGIFRGAFGLRDPARHGTCRSGVGVIPWSSAVTLASLLSPRTRPGA